MNTEQKIATRVGFGEEIVALGKENKDIYVVDIDIGKSCKTQEFRKELPMQHLNVGIAEQNGAGQRRSQPSGHRGHGRSPHHSEHESGHAGGLLCGQSPGSPGGRNLRTGVSAVHPGCGSGNLR